MSEGASKKSASGNEAAKPKSSNARNMKVAVLSFSGNVGKTTVSRQLLAPRMPGAREFVIETINASASDNNPDAEQLSGRETGDMLRELLMEDLAIADFGASNIEVSLQQLAQRPGAHEVFDYYLIPVIANVKQETDAVNTIKALAAQGIAARKILVVFNQVDVGDANGVESAFPILTGYHQEHRNFTLHPGAVIYQNEIFEKLVDLKTTVSDLVADETDYKAALMKARDARDEEAKNHAADMIAAKWMAASAHMNLNAVFKALFA